MAAAGKAQRYEAFVSDVLQRDLRRVQEQRDAILEQQAQVLQLRSALARLQEGTSPPLWPKERCGLALPITQPHPLRSRSPAHLSPAPSRLSDSLTRDGAKIRAHIRLVLEVTPPPFPWPRPLSPAGHAPPQRSAPLLRACGSCRGCRSPPR
ncbi:UXT protein, partial [Erythrocercus mccallii]|nr:UXT protein [Erythrocercus mccallii]